LLETTWRDGATGTLRAGVESCAGSAMTCDTAEG
jgi:hypothetical protein